MEPIVEEAFESDKSSQENADSSSELQNESRLQYDSDFSQAHDYVTGLNARFMDSRNSIRIFNDHIRLKEEKEFATQVVNQFATIGLVAL
jgi:hypothetical protein